MAPVAESMKSQKRDILLHIDEKNVLQLCKDAHFGSSICNSNGSKTSYRVQFHNIKMSASNFQRLLS